jgi:ribonuclease-3
MNHDRKLSIQKEIDYQFKDSTFIDTVFTHTSYRKNIHFDRLEFLGDRVLSFVAAEYLFKAFPEEATGQMSLRYIDITKTQPLAAAAIKMNLEDHVMCSTTPSTSVLADTIEALIGAIFLDGGYLKAKKFITTKIINTTSIEGIKNIKNLLQEWAQQNKFSMPNYSCCQENKNFHVKVKITGIQDEGYGIAKSKKEASIQAAERLLTRIKRTKH